MCATRAVFNIEHSSLLSPITRNDCAMTMIILNVSIENSLFCHPSLTMAVKLPCYVWTFYVWASFCTCLKRGNIRFESSQALLRAQLETVCWTYHSTILCIMKTNFTLRYMHSCQAINLECKRVYTINSHFTCFYMRYVIYSRMNLV